MTCFNEFCKCYCFGRCLCCHPVTSRVKALKEILAHWPQHSSSRLASFCVPLFTRVNVQMADTSACGCRSVRNLDDPQTDADGLTPEIRGHGLTQIINSSSALGKLTGWAEWADAIVLTDALYRSHRPWPCSDATAVHCFAVVASLNMPQHTTTCGQPAKPNSCI